MEVVKLRYVAQISEDKELILEEKGLMTYGAGNMEKKYIVIYDFMVKRKE